MEKPTIIITVAYGFTVRNILRSKLFELIKANFRIILLSKIKDPSFKKEFVTNEVTILDFPEQQFSAMQQKLYEIVDYCFNEFNKFALYESQKRLIRTKSLQKAVFFVAKICVTLFGDSAWYVLRCLLKGTFARNSYFKEIIEKHKPAIVFSTIQFLQDEWPLINEAQKAGVKTITLIHSWDNLSTKGFLLFKYSKYLVWNDILANELKKYYKKFGVNDAAIEIVGIPQHDYFVNDQKNFKNKADFLRTYGFSENMKIVLYTTAPEILTPNEDIVLKDLQDIIQRKSFKNVLTIVRVHPKDDPKRYRDVPSHNRFVIENAGRYCKDVDDKWNPSYDDMVHYAELLMNCDVNINFSSTVTLDAMAFNKPIINIA